MHSQCRQTNCSIKEGWGAFINDSMKKIICSIAIIATILACNSGSKEYLLPKDLNRDSRKNMVAYLNRGKALYSEFCASCHRISNTGDPIPHFTQQQLDMYQAKLYMQGSPKHTFVRELAYDEVEAILNYLRFRKPR